MKEEDKFNVDIDIYSLCKEIEGSKSECCLYFRGYKKEVSIGYSGHDNNFVKCFITMLNKHPEMYDVLCAALDFYENESEFVLGEESKN